MLQIWSYIMSVMKDTTKTLCIGCLALPSLRRYFFHHRVPSSGYTRYTKSFSRIFVTSILKPLKTHLYLNYIKTSLILFKNTLQACLRVGVILKEIGKTPKKTTLHRGKQAKNLFPSQNRPRFELLNPQVTLVQEQFPFRTIVYLFV